MNNFDIAREATRTSETSEGSAMKEQEKYMESIQYSMDRMKAQFQEFSTTAINSDLFKGLVDGGTAALDILTQIVAQFDSLGKVLAGAGAVFGITKFIKNFDQPQTIGCPGFPIFPGRVYHGGECAILAA